MKGILHSVLGTEYEVLLGDRKELPMSEENVGECRTYSKKIMVCTEDEECTEEELQKKVQEVLAHEFLHAYLNEAGVDLDADVEEALASFYMKNWRKMNNSVLTVLDEIGFMSVEAGRNWCEKATENYSISIEAFAQLVKKYIDKKGNNHHIVFLVDEIGQYIGDDSKLMLNLQTVTEDLGTACKGKAWIIVTSQQDIDSITKVKGNDFSKIQGRFDTRLSLSSTER